MRITFVLLVFLISMTSITAQQKPLKVGIIGLTHTHVHWIFNSEDRGEIEIVGIVEPNRSLASRYAEQYGFPLDRIYPTHSAMLERVKPEAVTAFGSIYDHLEVVETYAPLGIHIMVEKPLAVSMEHALRMAELAKRCGVELLTNYETTWYPTNHKARELVRDSAIGAMRKIVIRDGHRGPLKIGVDPEFLDWLTDPVQNGGGALVDFGCYGANLVTWLTDGQRPLEVTAITAQLQPENNPRVEDEAIILLKYPDKVAVIQGSWNWPIGRKDMEIYGLTGAIYADNRNELRIRMAEGYDGFTESQLKLEERKPPFDDPFALLAAVIQDDLELPDYDLSSLENNLLVVEILDAARKSARTGRSVALKDKP